MVNTCSIIGCYNRSQRDKKSFYSIPSIVKHQGEITEELSSRRRALWLSRLNRPNFVPSRYTKICSDHFITGKPSALYDDTNPDWAPSLRLCTYQKSKRGSKYKPRTQTSQGACSTSTPVDQDGAPRSFESCLQMTNDKKDITTNYSSVGNYSHSPTTTDSDGSMTPELSRLNQRSCMEAIPTGNGQPGVGSVLGNTDQKAKNSETAENDEKLESCPKTEDKGVYPVYLRSVDGEGWCL